MASLPVFQLIWISHVDSLASIVSGCSENSFSESIISLTGAAITPSCSMLSTFSVPIIVVSRSEAVIFSTPSLSSNRKLSRMGSVFLLLTTLLEVCNTFSSAVEDTTNFICYAL